MQSDLVEVSRCRDAESVSETTDILVSNNIPYKMGSTASNFDITTIGTGSNPEVIISVRRADYAAARAAMEIEYLKIGLPENHYLLTSTDDELADILGKPEEWSSFDVAHARKIVGERGIDESLIHQKKSQRIEQLKRGKRASNALVFFGWFFSLLGGIIGVGIAWSICFMRERAPEGDFFTYDDVSRERAKPMFQVACVMTVIATFVHIYVIFGA